MNDAELKLSLINQIVDMDHYQLMDVMAMGQDLVHLQRDQERSEEDMFAMEGKRRLSRKMKMTSRKNRPKSKKACKARHMDWNATSKRCNKSKSKSESKKNI